MKMNNISPCLWFDTQAEEAMKYYVSVFPNSKMGAVTYYGEGMQLPKGTVLTATATLNGQEFMGLNGGPIFKFSEAVSFMVNCDTQDEIDAMWEKLTADGGKPVQCGWLTDKYGLSWQIVPTVLRDLMKDSRKFERVLQAVMGMVKLDIKAMQQAYDQA
jgi:predicted 3-demethylubiquinone-9 3-methyltransferase (glyoxalase superfamily)